MIRVVHLDTPLALLLLKWEDQECLTQLLRELDTQLQEQHFTTTGGAAADAENQPGEQEAPKTNFE